MSTCISVLMHYYACMPMNCIHDHYMNYIHISPLFLIFLQIEHKGEIQKMSTLVGAIQQSSWGKVLQGRETYDAAGSRDLLIILQDETIQGEDIVPRRRMELTGDDKRELERLDLPPDQWEDDVSIMAARYSKDQWSSVTQVIRSRSGEPLMTKYMKKQIEILMNNTQKEGGKMIIAILKKH